MSARTEETVGAFSIVAGNPPVASARTVEGLRYQLSVYKVRRAPGSAYLIARVTELQVSGGYCYFYPFGSWSQALEACEGRATARALQRMHERNRADAARAITERVRILQAEGLQLREDFAPSNYRQA